MTTTLYCQISSIYPDDFGYYVHTGDHVARAGGISSSLSWVRHDASGFHTKRRLDEQFPDGWEVTFPDGWDRLPDFEGEDGGPGVWRFADGYEIHVDANGDPVDKASYDD